MHGHVFSFFTRNLARLAAPLVAILREHGQAIDPNLQRLAHAFELVAAKLGPDGVSAVLKRGDEAVAEGVPLVAEDVQEGLQQLRCEMRLDGKRGRRKPSGDRCAALCSAARSASNLSMKVFDPPKVRQQGLRWAFEVWHAWFQTPQLGGRALPGPLPAAIDCSCID